MQVQQLSVKYFAANPEALAEDELIPVFHDWIREKRIPDQLLIDVADYRHVPSGPGVMLIGHEAHYGVDRGGGLGLLYARKRDELGEPAPKLRDAFAHALGACALLEDDQRLGGVRFDVGRVVVKVVSRLACANDDEAFAALSPAVAGFLEELCGAPAELVRVGDPRDPLSIEARIAGPAARPADLAARLG